MLRPAALLLVIFAARLAAQQAAAAPPQASQAPSAASATVPAPAVDEAARAGQAALDAAARFQRGETPRSAPASLHGVFGGSMRDDKGNLVQLAIERWYTRSPERLVTHRKEEVTGISSTVGRADGVVWGRDDKSGTVTVYTDDPELFDADLELEAEQLRLTRLLLDACVLDALRPRLAHIRAAGHDVVTDPDGGKHPVTLVDATAPDEFFAAPQGAPPPAPGDEPPRLLLQFGIGTDDGALWSLRIQPSQRPDLPPMRLAFSLHGETRGGLRVPGNIKVFRDDEPDPALKLFIQEDAEGHMLFDLDTAIDPALFARPAPPDGG